MGDYQVDQHTSYRIPKADWEKESGRKYIWKSNCQFFKLMKNMNLHVHDAVDSKQDKFRDPHGNML